MIGHRIAERTAFDVCQKRPRARRLLLGEVVRLTPALLCFSIIFSAAPAADPALDTYLSARDRAVALVKVAPATEDHALAELDRLIRPIIPAWNAPGFSAKGEFSLIALDEGDVGYGAVDGLQYSRGDTVVTVTTKPLLARWMADHRKSQDARWKIPPVMTAAFRSDAFYTQAITLDDGIFLHGLVIVKAPAGTDLTVVELAAVAPDFVFDGGPDRLVAAVMRGETIFIAQEPLKDKLAPVPFCKKGLDVALARAKAEKDTGRADAVREKADREYRACFAQHLREQPNYAAVQKQAQALVDMLH